MIDVETLTSRRDNTENVIGYVEKLDRRHISGWAWRPDIPDQPVEIEIIVDGSLITRCSADRFRADLAAAGIGKGYHSFNIPLPPDIYLTEGCRVIVRVPDTGHELPWLPGIGRPLCVGNSESDGRDVQGRVDIIGPQVIRGWVRTPMPPAAVPIQVYWRDELLLEASVAGDRDDILLDDITRFDLTLPEHGARSPEEIKVLAEIDGAFVPLRHPEDGPDRFSPGFEVLDSATVLGWVAPRDERETKTVEVLQDGHVVWRGRARRLIRGQAIGFKVDLPEPQRWDQPAEISARFAEDGGLIGRPVIIRPIERFVGNIDSACVANKELVIAGWIHNKARPLDPLGVELRLNDVPIAHAKANRFREDLREAGYGAGCHAFMFSCPAPDNKVSGRLSIAVGDAEVFPFVSLDEPEPDYENVIDSDSVSGFKPDLRVCNVDGSVDTVRYSSVSGWARYREAPNERVLLDLFIDNSYYYSTLTGQHRADVGNKFGDHGNHGFFFELPPHIARGKDLEIRVTPRYGRVAFSSALKRLPRRPDGKILNEAPTIPPGRLCPAEVRSSVSPKVAYIVLNLDGEQLLEQLLESFERHNRYPNYEVVIVDHGSKDGSLQLCRTWASEIYLKIIERGENYSFSASNNYAVSQTDAEILIFLNNDIVFTQDVSPGIVALFKDESVGLAGIKLLDPPSDSTYAVAPIQHLGVHFHWTHRQNVLHPFESRYAPQLRNVVNDVYDVPAVTGALLACRRDEFLLCGGFDEGYFYGYEDVDLCLRYGVDLGKRVVCANSISAYHARGYSRGKIGPSLARRLSQNDKRLQDKFGKEIRRRMRQDLIARPGYWTTAVPRIGFAVTEASDSAAAGDYFTALELAQEIIEILPCQIVFFDKQDNWFDVAAVDVLITMRDDYDLRELQNVAPHLLKVGWARNWIDRWAEREWAQDYDVIWASSEKASSYLSKSLARPVEVVRIATNPERFRKGSYRPELASDYCFTGSYFGAPREIVFHLDPASLPFEFAIYGHRWEAVPEFAAYSRGPLPYSSMPDVYASTKVVIDDANPATKEWGSVNSRVFDALAAGALVITNGGDGASEAFSGLLPTYSSTQELEELLWKYLGDEEARLGLVAALQEKLVELHTYERRAQQVVTHLRRVAEIQLRFAIKIGTPREEVKEEWGDYHFALGLKRALTRLGHTVRIDCLNRWEGDHCLGDDVVIALRGLSRYEPKPHQLNLMWNISHPNTVSKAEYELYDHIFVASEPYAKELDRSLNVSVSSLLQCTDPELFNPSVKPLPESIDYLFVGNARNVYRNVVKYCVEANIPIEIHGNGWDGVVPQRFVKSRNIPNKQLARFYKSAKIILNDHWDDMKQNGFVSNRLFDAVATGSCVLTDYVPGMEAIFGDSIFVFHSKDEFIEIIPEIVEKERADKENQASAKILSCHTFDNRAEDIMRVVFAFNEPEWKGN